MYHWRAARRAYKESEQSAVDKDATISDLDNRCEVMEDQLIRFRDEMGSLKASLHEIVAITRGESYYSGDTQAYYAAHEFSNEGFTAGQAWGHYTAGAGYDYSADYQEHAPTSDGSAAATGSGEHYFQSNSEQHTSWTYQHEAQHQAPPEHAYHGEPTPAASGSAEVGHDSEHGGPFPIARDDMTEQEIHGGLAASAGDGSSQAHHWASAVAGQQYVHQQAPPHTGNYEDFGYSQFPNQEDSHAMRNPMLDKHPEHRD